ncbi:ATP-binding protein [Streptomyces sp. NPDC001185]|uniref:ATP-binding protein n=1 Tax=Streptomyces sp. NPDC001185 TaxID=3154380 RepID=UPI00331FF9A7
MDLDRKLAMARASAFVGRETERMVLDRVMSGEKDAPLVTYIHGPGGIGKSSLLRYSRQGAERAGRRVVNIDARFLDADIRRFEEASYLAVSEPGTALLIDSFEHCQSLEPWLRDTFMLKLADGACVVLASRVAPEAEWSLDPGWRQLFSVLSLPPLDANQSQALLAARGVPESRREAVSAFAGGSPLALSLAATAPTAAANVNKPWEPTGDVLTTLVERLVGDLPSKAHQRALDVVAQAYTTRESLLRSVLGDEDTTTLFSWLRQLPYIEATSEGLHPHDAVRATLEADLRWRDPERYEDIRVRVSAAGLQAVRSAHENDAQLRAGEWMFLFRNQDSTDDLYDWREHPHIEDVPLQPRDIADVLRMAHDEEGPISAGAVAHWVHRQPQAFRVYRYAGSSVPVAFMAMLRLEASQPEDRAKDPIMNALWNHVEASAPLGPGEHLGIRRFAVQAGNHQHPSPLMDVVSRRAIAEEMRTHKRAMTFTVFTDAAMWREHLANAGMYEIAAVDVGEQVQHIFGRDWRREPVEQWVKNVARAEVMAAAALADPSPVSDEGRDRLSQDTLEEAVNEALRTWHTPRAFATSILLDSRLVPHNSANPVTDLRNAITTALNAIQTDPAGVKAHEALVATYISASRTHRAAARWLGVPYGTYRRHLALAKKRLAERLLNPKTHS